MGERLVETFQSPTAGKTQILWLVDGCGDWWWKWGWGMCQWKRSIPRQEKPITRLSNMPQLDPHPQFEVQLKDASEPFQPFLGILNKNLRVRQWPPDYSSEMTQLDPNTFFPSSPQLPKSWLWQVHTHRQPSSVVTRFSFCWLPQRRASHPHAPSHIQGSSFLSWKRIFPRKPPNRPFLLSGWSEELGQLSKTNYC